MIYQHIMIDFKLRDKGHASVYAYPCGVTTCEKQVRYDMSYLTKEQPPPCTYDMMMAGHKSTLFSFGLCGDCVKDVIKNYIQPRDQAAATLHVATTRLTGRDTWGPTEWIDVMIRRNFLPVNAQDMSLGDEDE